MAEEDETTVNRSPSDTIVALATPEGNAALGVVRISGDNAWDIAAAATANPEGFQRLKPREAKLMRVTGESGDVLDQAVVLPWRGPSSYTGDDMVEFFCHGGRELLRLVVRRLTGLGARPAEPGEFTLRAFLNGKLSLDQSEAVAALIEARTEVAVRVAARLQGGGLRSEIQELADHLVDILSRIELELDFIEEDIKLEPRTAAAKKVKALSRRTSELQNQFRAGRFLRNGAVVVIGGAPNVGKSTLFNRLAGYDRAIVSDTPGTTRDYLDVNLDWDGVPIRLFDTAGLHDAKDAVEKSGEERARGLHEDADCVIWLMSPPEYESPPERLCHISRLITAVNKIDLLQGDVSRETSDSDAAISALTGKGIDELCRKATQLLLEGYDPGELLLVEERHANLLKRSTESMEAALSLIESEEGAELIATELRLALNALEEITGRITSEDLLKHIFSRFCIGK